MHDCTLHLSHRPHYDAAAGLMVWQVKELEELCGAQQNSLEEAEERYRRLQQEHDELHHTALAAKAQLVTAQAQVRTTTFTASCSPWAAGKSRYLPPLSVKQ
jgi:adenine-specific DNA methylase